MKEALLNTDLSALERQRVYLLEQAGQLSLEASK